MGFFSNLIDLAPNRTVAHAIKEYCSSTSLNDKEIELIKNSKINEQQYIWQRNAINYRVFGCFIQFMNRQYPNTYWSITGSKLDEISHEVFYSQWRVSMFQELNVSLPTTYGLWESYFDDFCSSIEKKSSEKMPEYVREQLQTITNEHQAEIIKIVKTNSNKLNKPL